MTAADRHAPDTHADERETLAELIGDRLRLIHFDGTGCGTHGSNACSNCHGPSPMDSYEIGCDLADTLRAAGVRGPEAVAQIEGERDAALAATEELARHVGTQAAHRAAAEARLAAVERLANTGAPDEIEELWVRASDLRAALTDAPGHLSRPNSAETTRNDVNGIRGSEKGGNA